MVYIKLIKVAVQNILDALYKLEGILLTPQEARYLNMLMYSDNLAPKNAAQQMFQLHLSDKLRRIAEL